MKVLRYKKVVLGELNAHQFTLFEWKRAFSILVYYFEGDGWQDRYHTHAFNAWSLKLFGTYQYRELVDGVAEEAFRREVLRYFPRSTNHMLGPSAGCLTILLAGPWNATWQETKGGRARTLAWGRRTIETSAAD